MTFYSIAASADITPTRNPIDLGVTVGALYSKTITLKMHDVTYHVIGADFDEPACNPVQAILNIEDPSLEGVETVTYNLGIQISRVQSAKAANGEVILKVRQNNPEDCSKFVLKTMRITYKGNAADLVVRSEEKK